MIKKILMCFIVIIILLGANTLYWVTSDVQQHCYLKIKNNTELSFYEKSSVYIIHLSTCAFGWILSPESTRQQIWCLFPTKSEIIRHSKHLFEDKNIQHLIEKNPSATINNPIRVTFKPDYNEFGLYSAYNHDNMRTALACNGCYLFQENGMWVISPITEYAFPKLPSPTIIGPFKFHESLIRYLQDIGWLYKPKYKWTIQKTD